MAEKKSYLGYNNSGIINLDSNEVGASMLDKFSRIRDERRLQPLDQMIDNVFYAHRALCDEYNLMIGDTYFLIPPEFIMVNSESQSQSIVTLRQENSMHEKAGFHKRIILIDLVFNGINQLNGFPVDGPDGKNTYYMDGLRQLLAQFKCTPILPITNELINGMYGIFTVALQSITMSTIEGFPDAMTCQITLQEIEMFPYINMPNATFKYMIDWDLFRFYYQRFLTEKHEYKKLQSLDANKEHNRFKLSILDESVFSSSKATKYNLLDIITDTEIVKQTEDGENDTTNYTTWVSSDDSDVHISQFNCGYSNLLTNIQLSDSGSPTIQFLGGMDTIYNITFETTDYSVVQCLEQCQMQNDVLTRNNAKFHSLGFVKLESELVEFTGSLFVMIESVTTNTVPSFPGLYNVQIQCVSYDISQSEREELNGFKPFDCTKKGKCGKYVGGTDGFVSDHTHDEQVIEQTMGGLKIKATQDNYAEWKIRSTMEVYPDLRLPKYSEVNAFITKCNKFRKDNGLPELPYKKYPKAPTYLLHGLKPDNKMSYSYASKGILDTSSVKLSSNDYNIYVDPDFYVFYPSSYLSFLEDDKDVYGAQPHQRKDQVKTKTVERPANYAGVKDKRSYSENKSSSSSSSSGGSSSKADDFVKLAQSFIGHTYVWGAEGEVSDSKGKCFDCSGLVTYCLKEIGVVPSKGPRFTVSDILSNNTYFKTVPWSKRQRGDLLCEGSKHVVICEGGGKIVHASNSAPYPKGGVKEAKEYFKGTVRRVKAFYKGSKNTSNAPITSVNGSTNMQKVWNLLKQYGCTDVTAAGIIGNMGRETGGTFDPTTVEGRGHSNTIPSKGGYGLVQYTYSGYKKGLRDYCSKNGLGVNTFEGQIGYLMSIIKNSSYFKKMQSTNDVTEATKLFQDGFEKPGVKAFDERVKYAKEAYAKYAGSASSGSNNASTGSKYTLTQAEFDSICKVVDKATQGEPAKTQTAVAQVIYDRLTHPSKLFGGLSNILNGANSGFSGTLNREPSDSLKKRVKDVFCNNKKYWKNSQAWYFLTPKDNNASYKERDKKYDRLNPESVGKHTFWGKNKKGSNIKYTIVDGTGTGDASENDYTYQVQVTYSVKNISETKKFGTPVYVETDAIMYDNNFTPWGNKEGKIAENDLNSNENIFNTSFCDEVEYSGKGRLVRAFPAYLFCILDEDSKWYDGKKLWTNYYVHKAVIDIAVHSTNDMPTSTATVTVSNSYHNLDRVQGGLDNYSLKKDVENGEFGLFNGSFNKLWYKLTGSVLGFGPKLTDQLIKLHQIIYDHARLREGARVHLRMGYGSDPLGLAPVINGHISDVSLGDQINIVVTSDGHELIQNVTSANEKSTNNGWLGLFGLGKDQESSNIIAGILCKRKSWVSHICGYWFEASEYSIEHFGLYFNKTVMYMIKGVSDGAIKGFKNGGNTGQQVGEAIGANIPILSDITGFIGKGVGSILGGVTGSVTGLFDDLKDLVTDLWDGEQEQYDLLKNIYKANYKCQHYIYTTAIMGADGEENVVFNNYNMTPWDVFQICTQQVPEYIVKPEMHQFDSRLYFGLPFWMEKYRYDVLNGHIFEECKTAAQVHFIDSMDTIIDDQVKVTSKFSNTNIKVMYTRGKSPVSTKIIHSDDTIDASKQKTTIMDSPICQDALGPDAIYEFLGYNIGEESARRVGISNLLYGWQQQYQGSLICMGCPGVKPHDYLMVNDTYANLFGICIVREVVHSFSTSTGYTTSITPGMVSYSTDENSGMIPVVNNYLMLLSCFANYTLHRKGIRNNYEKNINVVAEIEIGRQKIIDAYDRKRKFNKLNTAQTVVTDAISVGVAAFKGKQIYGFVKNLCNVKTLATIAKEFIGPIKALKGTAVTIKNLITAVRAGSIAAGSVAGGFPGVILASLWFVVDMLIDDLFEWFDNKNVVALLPMWWEGYPFVAGVKDGTKILLCDSNSTSTDDESSSKDSGRNDDETVQAYYKDSVEDN